MSETVVLTQTRWDVVLQRLDDYRYILPKSYRADMRVDALIFASPKLLPYVCHDLSLEQAANVATLPGIIKNSLVMPDVHQGYGFPIGGVAAMDLETGVVSPGGVGFDINCGVRLLTSSLPVQHVRARLKELIDELYKAVPAGTGTGGNIRLSEDQLFDVLLNGSRWALANGYAVEEDLAHTEEGGCLDNADPFLVSQRAKRRGSDQLGTLGSGNHFLEVQYVEQIFDEVTAHSFGLFPGQVCVMVHCGSRGLGHQVCTDFVGLMGPTMERYGIKLPDRELACCPIKSEEGQRYLSAMAAAANFAFANRQCISASIREVFRNVFGSEGEPLALLYDVAHNMAKLEVHKVDGQDRKVLVHRKGATRAFPAGRPELSGAFRSVGQPVIIPGDMGRGSYILVGTQQALEETFGSVCHGAGRLMSRTKARKGRQSKDVVEELAAQGIIAKATTREGLTEEVSEAYKPIDEVVLTVENAGLARRVARMHPLGVVKG